MTKSNLEIDKQLYQEQCKAYQDLIEQSKCHHYQTKIAESDDKDLFRCVNKLCSPSSGHILPEHTCAKTLANNFGVFFHEKVKTINDTLNDTVVPEVSVQTTKSCSSLFTDFAHVSEETVLKVIKESASTTCGLDPIPTFLRKDCLDVLLPYITQIINGSLESGVVPSIYKTAHLKPLINKPNLPTNYLKNYRPVAVSNKDLANQFCSFFTEKIKKIREGFQIAEDWSYDEPSSAFHELTYFPLATEDEISNIILYQLSPK